MEERVLPVTSNYLENGSTGYVKNNLFVHYYYSIYVKTDNPGTVQLYNGHECNKCATEQSAGLVITGGIGLGNGHAPCQPC